MSQLQGRKSSSIKRASLNQAVGNDFRFPLIPEHGAGRLGTMSPSGLLVEAIQRLPSQHKTQGDQNGSPTCPEVARGRP